MKVFYIAKRQFFFILLPGLLLFSTLLVHSHQTPDKSQKVIVVDAGHGGVDSGANRPGVVEKDINLAIALQLKQVLNESGIKVVLSRESDVELSPECDNEKVRGRYHRDLAARVELVEESDADLFISIHANAASKASQCGTEVYYFGQSEASKDLSTVIKAQLEQATSHSSSAKKGDFFVLRRNKIPAVLVEVGYITNPEERELLQSAEYQRKIAEAIGSAINTFYSNICISK